MGALLNFSRAIDRLNAWVGRYAIWLIMGSTVISAANALVRYTFNTSSNAFLEIQWYLFAWSFLIAAGFTLLNREHVRIDVLNSRLPKKAQMWIDILGFAFFLTPVCLLVLYYGIPMLMEVNILIFFLAFFLDYFELSFIVVPLLAPVADKLGIDLIWFGVLLAVNMQTSFMHPPFGFALFFLRSVAPDKPYVDRVTNKVMAPVTTMQIYKGAIPFLIIQLFMVGVLIAFPGLVTGSLDKVGDYDLKAVGEQMRENLAPDSEGGGYGGGGGYGADEQAAPPEEGSKEPPATKPEAAGEASPDAKAAAEDDPMKAMQEALGRK